MDTFFVDPMPRLTRQFTHDKLCYSLKDSSWTDEFLAHLSPADQLSFVAQQEQVLLSQEQVLLSQEQVLLSQEQVLLLFDKVHVSLDLVIASDQVV
jgi:hypothetical protein